MFREKRHLPECRLDRFSLPVAYLEVNWLRIFRVLLGSRLRIYGDELAVLPLEQVSDGIGILSISSEDNGALDGVKHLAGVQFANDGRVIDFAKFRHRLFQHLTS